MALYRRPSYPLFYIFSIALLDVAPETSLPLIFALKIRQGVVALKAKFETLGLWIDEGHCFYVLLTSDV